WWTLRSSEGLWVRRSGGWLAELSSLRDHAFVFRIVLAVVTLLLMVALFSVFALWKASIVQISPWHWDATLIGIERAFHGGVLPQELTRKWFGPGATVLLDDLYYLWFRLLALFIVWQSFRAPSQRRTRTLLAVALVYTLLGNLAALLFSSGGPVYYSRLVGWPDPYAEQAAYLSTIPGLRATQVQDAIWRWLMTDTYVPFGSISAMPSMHVAAVTVIALACWEYHRWLGAVAWLYVLLILVGSVHLNWHYAIDGYAAILGTLAVWWLSGWLVRRFRPGEQPV
ncbi:MAG: phosphatase PAP2 family protein, partial [Gemmatimonadales bacterium]|nr:phosphatase PAP2 family protein [Gemmatimonadales bacterium]